jgi:hypothetical protein
MPVNTIKAQGILKELWESEDTPATVLFSLVLDEWGNEALEWEPKALQDEIKITFNIKDIPQVNFDKVHTLHLALTTDLVHTDAATFIQSANALNNTAIDFDIFDPADVYECAWTIAELGLVDPETKERLSSDVRRYIGEICAEQGLYRPPPVLSSVADFGEEDYSARIEEAADDPESLSLMGSNQQDFAESVSQYVRERLELLIRMLDRVPFRNKDVEMWAKFYKNFTE